MLFNMGGDRYYSFVRPRVRFVVLDKTHLEHVFRYPVHAVLFLFGLVNAGVVLSGYGTGTWAVLVAALVGKPMGLLLGAAAGVALGLRLPRGLHWRDLTVTCVRDDRRLRAWALFRDCRVRRRTAPRRIELGVILSGIGVVLTFVVASLLKVGRFHAPGPTPRRALVRHAVAAVLLGALLVPVAVRAQGVDDPMSTFQKRLAAYLDVRERARDDIASEHIIDSRIRQISGALLAARLRAMRPQAAEGDVFSTQMAGVIRDRLHRAFDELAVDAMLSGMYGDELPPFAAARVNFGCVVSVLAAPPVGVLAALPPLPGILGYRLAGRDLILWDEEANIVVDVIRDALPQPRIWDFVEVSSFGLRSRIRETLERTGIDRADLLEEIEYEAPQGWRAMPGEPFRWGASGVMPPTVLHALPALPAPLEYRFVGSDLVAVNIETEIVSGVLNAALRPRAFGPRL